MEFTKEQLRKTVREALAKMSRMGESDLVTRKGDKSWSKQKEEFKEKVDTLLNHIEDDEYEDADGLIDDTINILKVWKTKIKEGIDGKIIK